MRFAANLSTLCQDLPKLTDRLAHLMRRNDYKFTAVECQNPYGTPVEEWRSALAAVDRDVEWALINSPPLFNAFPDKTPSVEEYHKSVLEQTLDYAKGLNVRRVHLIMKDVQAADQVPQIEELLDYAAKQFEPHGIMCVIEPLSIRNEYYLRSYDLAVDIVQRLQRPNLKVMLDTFHLQMLHGNLTQRIQTLLPWTGHVQISQAPLRNCPMIGGEINYSYVLKLLSRHYDGGPVGLEYNNESSESFSWLNDFE